MESSQSITQFFAKYDPNQNGHTMKYKTRNEFHLLFFKPAGFASKRAFTKAPTLVLKASSEKLSCRWELNKQTRHYNIL